MAGHVRDRWTVPGPTGRRVKGPLWGRGRRWQARWIDAGRECSQTFASKETAEHHLARVELGEIQPVAQQVTVAAYVPIWLAMQLHYADNSRRAATDRLSKHVVPLLGGHQLGAVSRMDVQRAVAVWSETLAPSTVRQTYSFLSSMFTTALEDGLIRSTPCVRVNLPAKRRTRVVPLTVDLVQQVADRVNPRYRSMVVVGAATGMRGAELRGLTLDRLVGDDVVIDRQLVDVVGRRPVWDDLKSSASERRIGLGKVAQQVLDDHLEEYGAGVDGLIWTTRESGPVNRSRSQDIWRRATKDLPMRPRSGWHDLRHHHASLLIAAGMSPRAVGERLGHADASECLRTYAHLWPDDEDRMIAAVDSALVGLLTVS